MTKQAVPAGGVDWSRVKPEHWDGAADWVTTAAKECTATPGTYGHKGYEAEGGYWVCVGCAHKALTAGAKSYGPNPVKAALGDALGTSNAAAFEAHVTAVEDEVAETFTVTPDIDGAANFPAVFDTVAEAADYFAAKVAALKVPGVVTLWGSGEVLDTASTGWAIKPSPGVTFGAAGWVSTSKTEAPADSGAGWPSIAANGLTVTPGDVVHYAATGEYFVVETAPYDVTVPEGVTVLRAPGATSQFGDPLKLAAWGLVSRGDPEPSHAYTYAKLGPFAPGVAGRWVGDLIRFTAYEVLDGDEVVGLRLVSVNAGPELLAAKVTEVGTYSTVGRAALAAEHEARRVVKARSAVAVEVSA